MAYYKYVKTLQILRNIGRVHLRLLKIMKNVINKYTTSSFFNHDLYQNKK